MQLSIANRHHTPPIQDIAVDDEPKNHELRPSPKGLAPPSITVLLKQSSDFLLNTSPGSRRRG